MLLRLLEVLKAREAAVAGIAKDNPDLPMPTIREILVAQEESKAGLGEPYQWGGVKE